MNIFAQDHQKPATAVFGLSLLMLLCVNQIIALSQTLISNHSSSAIHSTESTLIVPSDRDVAKDFVTAAQFTGAHVYTNLQLTSIPADRSPNSYFKPLIHLRI